MESTNDNSHAPAPKVREGEIEIFFMNKDEFAVKAADESLWGKREVCLAGGEPISFPVFLGKRER